MSLAGVSYACCAPLRPLPGPRGASRREATSVTAPLDAVRPPLGDREQGFACALSHSRSHSNSKHHPSPRRLAVSTRAVASGVQATALPESWGSFSSLVSGEWEGYASDFATDGTPLQLPESAVPQAFRDWGLSLFAWQSHSSSLADPTGMVSCRTQRFMPAVACDSLDPPVFSVQEELFGNSQLDTGGQAMDSSSRQVHLRRSPPTASCQPNYRMLVLCGFLQPLGCLLLLKPRFTLLCNHAGVLAFRSDGSFAAARPGRSVLRSGTVGQGKVVQREEVGSELVFELEHCLVAQDPEGSGRARVRVLQQYERKAPDAVPRLTGLTLYRERWTGEYAGDSADGGSTSFAEGPAVGLEAVEGRWLASKMVATFDQVWAVEKSAVL